MGEHAVPWKPAIKARDAWKKEAPSPRHLPEGDKQLRLWRVNELRFIGHHDQAMTFARGESARRRQKIRVELDRKGIKS